MTRPNNPDNPRTQISVKRTTRDRLNKLKIVEEEFLDSVVKRLIESYEEIKE